MRVAIMSPVLCAFEIAKYINVMGIKENDIQSVLPISWGAASTIEYRIIYWISQSSNSTQTGESE